MLQQRLAADEQNDRDQHGGRQQNRVPVARDDPLGEGDDQKAEKGNRADKRRRDGNQRSDEKQQAGDALSPIDAKPDRVFPAQQENIENVAHSPGDENTGDRQNCRRGQQAGLHAVEIGKGGVLGNREFIGIDKAGDERGEASEENAEHHAGKQHQAHIDPHLQDREEQGAGQHHQQQHLAAELEPHIKRGETDPADQQDEQELPEDIESIEPHDRGCEDAVAGCRLEQHSRDGDGNRNVDKGCQAREPEFQRKSNIAAQSDEQKSKNASESHGRERDEAAVMHLWRVRTARRGKGKPRRHP